MEKTHKASFGFRSAVEYLGSKICFATGSSGTDYSLDGGYTWINLSTQNFNALQKAKKGNLVLLTGNRGNIYQLVW